MFYLIINIYFTEALLLILLFIIQIIFSWAEHDVIPLLFIFNLFHCFLGNTQLKVIYALRKSNFTKIVSIKKIVFRIF